MPTEIPLSDGTTLQAELFLPEAPGPAGAVLVVPSIFGSDRGTLTFARRIAEAGHPVLGPTLFQRTDPGPAGFDPDGVSRARARMRTYDREQGLSDLTAAAAFLRARPEVNGIVAHGICFGGHLAAILGQRGVVDSVHTVHGSGIERVAPKAPLPCPLTFHTGSADSTIPPEAIEAISAAWPHAEITMHDGAHHGFAHPGSPAFVSFAYEASVQTLLRDAGRLTDG